MGGFIFRICGHAMASTLLLAGIADAHPADAPPSAANTAPNEGESIKTLLAMMQQGDADGAVRVYQSATDPVVHAWAAMVIERIHFDLDKASADARICEDALADSKPGIALLCGQFRSGNLRLVGKRAEATDLDRDLTARLKDHGVDKELADMQSHVPGDEPDAPALTYDIPADDLTIPLEQSWQPKFRAQANGHDFDLMLDTGASYMALDADQAKAFGVRLSGRKGATAGWLSKGVDAEYGTLDELKIGSITLHNVPVEVLRQKIALIGSSLIAPLGTLRISLKDDAAITVYADGSKNVPACDTPMRISSDLRGGNFRIHPRLLVEDEPDSVMLDTGASPYLLGSQAALDNVTVLRRKKGYLGDIGGSHAFANKLRAKVKITIAGQPFDVYFEVLTDSNVGAQGSGLTLGAGALRDMDFLLDFRHQRQCFLLHPDLH